jgi:hypothetical protein
MPLLFRSDHQQAFDQGLAADRRFAPARGAFRILQSEFFFLHHATSS